MRAMLGQPRTDPKLTSRYRITIQYPSLIRNKSWVVGALFLIGCGDASPPITEVAPNPPSATQTSEPSGSGMSDTGQTDTAEINPGRPNTDPKVVQDATSERSLPMPGEPNGVRGSDVVDDVVIGDDDDAATATEPQRPADQVIATLDDPPSAKPLIPDQLWVDVKRKRIYLNGYVALRDGPLEMFACGVGTKEHESVVAVLPKASQVHAALLAIGASPGTPVKFDPKFVPATGQRIRVWVAWRDDQHKFRCVDARRWIRDDSDQPMNVDWVFAGSSEWTDPRDNITYYQADGGDMICVSNFSTAMMDVPELSSAEGDDLIYRPNTPEIPSRYTPVRLILVPIPIPPETSTDAETAPDASVLPLKAP